MLLPAGWGWATLIVMTSSVEAAHEAYAREDWAAAFAGFSAAIAEGGPAALDAAGHERRAVAAYLVGADDDSTAAWEAAHRGAQAHGDPATAARCAFWLGLGLLLRGRPAQAGGWLARARRLIDETSLPRPPPPAGASTTPTSAPSAPSATARR